MAIRILLIEDNPDHIMITKRILEKRNGKYQVDSADEARRGLRKIIEDAYDLILCDYRMPGLSALDILREIKREGKDIPFIVITASGSERAAVDLMKEGAYDYILKDLSYEDTLPVVIKRSIERYNARKEKQRLEEQIKKAAKEWETTFNSIMDWISIHNIDFNILRVNKAFADAFGTTPEELVGNTCYEVVHKIKEPPSYCPHKHTLETKQPTRAEFFEPHLEIYLECSTSPIFNEEKELTATVHVVKNITKRKKAEKTLEKAYLDLKEAQQQLIQSGKMAAVGQLAAGISHELNQPLTGIKGFTQAILMDLDKHSPIAGDLRRIEEQADRMDNIIKNIRFFARKSEFKMQELDVNKPLEDSFMLLGVQLKVHNISLRKYLAKNLPHINGDPNQLQQAFLNLLTNARDAIDSLKRRDGGEITVKTSLSKDKKYVEVIFQDTGCGISKENLDNIFNPFFTTKSPNGGIGLGLSIVYRIIENHNGRIGVESRTGEGATFRITLPILPTVNSQ